jgi:hypothetical protein
MKLKLDDKGAVVLLDGKPVYVKDDGSEVAFDAAGTVSTIARLNGEAKGNRERAEAAEGKLKGFEGIDDVEAAKKALGIVANLDSKKLIDSGEVEKVKSEISKAFQTQLDAANGKNQTLEQQLYSEKVGGAFSRSKFIAEKLAIPADLVEARFGRSFGIEEGRIVAKDSNGNKLYSSANPGELASFDEALGMLVQQYPNRDQILKGSSASGSGSSSSQGAGGKKTVGRAAFDALPALEKATMAKEFSAGTAVLTD